MIVAADVRRRSERIKRSGNPPPYVGGYIGLLAFPFLAAQNCA